MGKKGDLLRAQKANSTVYTFTRAQLAQHDEHVINAHMERIRERAKEYTDKIWDERTQENLAEVNREWDKRMAEFKSGDSEDDFYNLLSYMLCISSRVLIERFGWKPIPKDGMYDRRNRTMRFADAIVDELNKISEDELMDICRYNEETYELYGVKFTRSDD